MLKICTIKVLRVLFLITLKPQLQKRNTTTLILFASLNSLADHLKFNAKIRKKTEDQNRELE